MADLPPCTSVSRSGVVYKTDALGLAVDEIGHVMRYEGLWEARDKERRPLRDMRGTPRTFATRRAAVEALLKETGKEDHTADQDAIKRSAALVAEARRWLVQRDEALAKLAEEQRQAAALREALEAEKALVQRLRSALAEHHEDHPWAWIGDVSDDLDSMSEGMVILIKAGDLRALLAERSGDRG